LSRFRNLSLHVVSQGLQFSAPLLLTPVYTRFIPPEEYGVQSMAAVLVPYGLMLANWGFTAAYERFFFSSDEPRRQRLLGTIFSFSALVLLAATAAVWLGVGPLSRWLLGEAEWAPMVPLVFFSGVLVQLNAYCLASLNYRQQALHFTALDLGRFVAAQLVALPLVALGGWGIWGVVAGQAVAQAATLAAVIALLGGRQLFTLDPGLLGECLRFGWPLMARVVFSTVGTTLDRYLVGSLVSLAALGLYAKAQIWASLAFLFMTTIQNVYAPLWNQALYDRGKPGAPVLGRVFSEYCMLSLPPAVLLVLFAPEIVALLAPQAYYGAIPLTAMLAAFYAVLTFGKLYGSVTNYLKLVKVTSAIGIATQCVTIGANLVLVARWGALGAVLAYIVPQLANLLVLWWLIRRHQALGLEARFLAWFYGLLLLGLGACLADYYADWPWALSFPLRLAVLAALGALVLRHLGRARLVALYQQLRRRATA
jgi:O-antigen/teichoic acid export membrane protein